MKKRLLTVPMLGAVIAFGAVACNGDDNTTQQLDNWAKSVCGSARDPMAQSRTAFADTGKIVSGEAPADLQKRLSADLATLATSTQRLADGVDRAGAPKTDDGGAVQKDAVGELKQAAQGYLDAQQKLDGLGTADQAKFADGLRRVADQVQQLSQLSTQALAKLQSGPLGDAMRKQPGCKYDAVGASAAPALSGSPSAPDSQASFSSAPAPVSSASSSASSAAPSAPASAKASASASPKASSR